MTFDDVIELTRTVSSNTAFEDPECQAYFDILMALKPGAMIVEVGLEYGRSSSIALQVAREHHLCYHGIDPFTSHPEAFLSWIRMAESLKVDFTLWKMPVARVYAGGYFAPGEIAAVLIDGDHAYDAIAADLEYFVIHVERGGVVMCHDYGRESLPAVYQAATECFHKTGRRSIWKEEPAVGTLGIWRQHAATGHRSGVKHR